MQALTSCIAVSTLISCRCARFVASGDIVTFASVAGAVGRDGASGHAPGRSDATATTNASGTRVGRSHPSWRRSPGPGAGAAPGHRHRQRQRHRHPDR